MKTSFMAGLAFLSVLALAARAQTAAPSPVAAVDRKLTDAPRTISDLTKGTAHVIVMLATPPAHSQTDFGSKRSLEVLQAEIRQRRQAVLDTLPANDVRVEFRFDNIAGFSARVTLAGLQALQAHPQVVSIEPVFILEPHLAQGIPLIHGMTYRSTYNGAGLAIAICDTGIDYTHVRLGGGGFPNGKVLGGYDFGDNDANPIPNTQAHGTCCAGIAAGDLGTVGDYIGGVAYNAKLYAVKISSGTTGNASTAAMVSAWDWCVTHKNDNASYPIMVISTSFGGGQYFATCDSATPSMTTAANNASAAGITVLASSGNDGYCDSMGWPACISSVISVGAVYDAAFGTYLPCISSASCAPTKTATAGCSTGYYATDSTAADKVTSYANVASFLTLFAPGNQCYTLDITGSSGYSSGDYTSDFGGTSAACPYAAGAVACLQSAAKALTGSYLTPQTVRTILTSNGDNVTDTKVAITKPRVNLERAILSLTPATNPILNYVSATLAGNGNQSVDPNECNDLAVLLRNNGNGTATNISATLTTTTPGVTVVQASSPYPNIAPAASATNNTSFRISTSPAFTCGTPVVLTLTVTHLAGTNTLPFTLSSGSSNYVIIPSTGASIAPGVTDIGNHGDDVTTAISLPFAYTFYGQTFSSATVSGNGNLQFTSADGDYANSCLPVAAFNNAIFAFWDDLRTDGNAAPTQGIYISTNGSAPNRIFNIEWRASYYATSGNGNPVNFEIRLYEGLPRFDIIYATLNGTGTGATSGAQKDTGSIAAQFSCNSASLSNGLQLTFQQICTDGGGACSATTANFTGAPTSGFPPLTVNFSNLSTGATNYSWNFGDSHTSTSTNASNTYSNAGSYTVQLTAIGAGSTSVLTRTDYILVTNPPPVVANFTGNPTSGAAPLTISLTNLSTGATNYAWTFGDAATSTSANPVHSYTNIGSYSVSLTAVGASGTNVLTRTNYIFVTNAPPTITTQPQDQIASLGANATFTVIAAGTLPLGYQWRFNGTDITDATTSAYTRASAQFADQGDYSVVVSNIVGTATSSNAALTVIVAPGVIPITGAPYSENFDSMGSNGTVAPLGWYVGTGTAGISGTNVTVGNGSANSGGNYNFGSTGDTDRALGSLASNSTQRDTEARFVNVSGSFIMSFTISYSGEQWRVGGNGSVNNDLVLQYSTNEVNFTALGAAFNFNTPLDSGSAGPLDGNAAPNRVTGIGGIFAPASPIADGQTFYLRWVDADNAASDNAMAVDDFVITFTVTNLPPLVDFAADPLSGLAPLTVQFTNASSGATNYTWDFGDGNFSSAANPANTFTNAGSYTITLTVVGLGGTNVFSRSNYIVATNLPPPLANFVASPTSGNTPLTVHFTNLTTGVATAYDWDFGDGNNSTDQDPANTFILPGTYTVQLTAISPGGTNTLTRTNYIQVAIANTPPVLLPQADHTIAELTTLTVTNTATDLDLPPNQLTYALLDAPTGASIDTNGVITWSPDESQGPGTNLITSVATDDGAPPMSATNSFTVVVTEVNMTPVLPPQTNHQIAELTTLTVTNTANDADLPTNSLTYSLLDPPAGAVVDSNGVITWTPDESQGPGTNVLTMVVTDGALSTTNSFTVTVDEMNAAPVLLAQTNWEIAELATLTVTNTATDTDLPANTLTYELLDPPPGANIDTNGIITWVPSHAQGPSTNVITTVVSDDGAPPLSATNRFMVTVTNVLDPTPPDIQSITRSNDVVTVSWVSATGQTYRLQFKDKPEDLIWSDQVPDVLATGALSSATNMGGYSTSFTNGVGDVTTIVQRFYRVMLVP